MALINLPPLREEMILSDGRLSLAWTNWFMQAFRGVLSVYESGTTAQRPVTGLWPGRIYFDTSLGANGKPIFCNKTATGWVLADGTAA